MCELHIDDGGGVADRLFGRQYHSSIQIQPNRSLLHFEHGGRTTAMYFVTGIEPR